MDNMHSRFEKGNEAPKKKKKKKHKIPSNYPNPIEANMWRHYRKLQWQ